MRYVPGVTAHQGENNRDQIIMRGNSSSADFFLNGVRDDVQYYRDLYNLERIEVLKGPNAMIFGRGGGGGVINRVTKEAGFGRCSEFSLLGGSFDNKRISADSTSRSTTSVAVRLNGVFEDSESFRDFVELQRYAAQSDADVSRRATTPGSPSATNICTTTARPIAASPRSRAGPRTSIVDTFYGDPDQATSEAVANIAHGHDRASLRRRVNIRNRTLFGDYDRFYQNFVPGAVERRRRRRSTLTAYNNATQRAEHLQPDGPDLRGVSSAACATRCSAASSLDGRRRTISATPASSTTRHSILVPFAIRRSIRR